MQKIIIKDSKIENAFYIMDIDNPKDICDILKNICSKVGQGVVYLVL